MKKTILTKLVSIGTIISLSITGCGNVSNMQSDDVTKYDMSRSTTIQQIKDYYKQALDYDSVISRTTKVHETTYETQEIKGDKELKIKQLVADAQAILGQDEYLSMEDEDYAKARKIISPDTFYYLKGVLDNSVLTNGRITSIKGALGYYFADVEYDEKPKTPGQFNQRTSLLGINGVFVEDFVTGAYSLDMTYLETIVKSLNRYYYDNKIMKNAKLENGVFSVVEGEAPQVVSSYDGGEHYSGVVTEETSNLNDYSDSALNGTGEGVTEEEAANEPKTAAVEDAEVQETDTADELTAEETAEETTEETTEETAEETAEGEEQATDEDIDTTVSASSAIDVNGDEVNIVSKDRQIQINIDEINSILGSVQDSLTIYPNLTDIYIKPEQEGQICGYGIYEAGGSGLRIFGLNREKIEGTITLRFVFKDAVDGSGDIVGVNAYVYNEELKTGYNKSSSNLNIPTVLAQRLDTLVERADRLQADYNLSSLMSGSVYTDMGVGVLRGFRDKNTGITKYMSKIRQILERDNTSDEKTYLLNVENTVTEGAKDVDSYGTFRDEYFIVAKQDGEDFHIVDQLRTKRTVVNEPAINPDSAVKKSLVALHLAGDVSDTNKDAIKRLLYNLYKSGTDRILTSGEKEVNGQKVYYERGLEDLFDTDPTMLSTDNREYILSELENRLIKYGTNVQGRYSGKITEWIGGYDNQVELTTEELIYYPEREKANYTQVYYLITNMHDEWVITEMRILDQDDYDNSNDIDPIKERIPDIDTVTPPSSQKTEAPAMTTTNENADTGATESTDTETTETQDESAGQDVNTEAGAGAE